MLYLDHKIFQTLINGDNHAEFIIDAFVSIRTIKNNDENKAKALLKIINGIEPSIILAFSVFCDKAVLMYSNYRKKTEFSSISQSLLISYLRRYAFPHTNKFTGGMLLIIQNNITYEKVEFDLKKVSKPKCHIGAWGQRRAGYLRQFQPERYNAMLCNETIGDHLERIDKEASELYDKLMKDFANQDDITSPHQKAIDIVYEKIIFKD